MLETIFGLEENRLFYFIYFLKITDLFKSKVKLATMVKGDPKGSLFNSLLHQCVGEGATPFPGWFHFTLDPYLKMLSVKQGGIKYHFFESLV